MSTLALGVEQFPSRTPNNCFLKSIFLSSMSASIKKKVSQNRTKYCNKQTNKTTIFSAKKNKVRISELNFTKSEGKVRFKQNFLNDPLDEP